MEDHQESFELMLRFAGLCAFVPRSDGRKLWVLLPNGTEADRDNEREKLRPHFAIITFPIRYLRPGGSVPGDLPIYWDLFNQELEIWPGGQPDTEEGFHIPGFSADGGDISERLDLVPPDEARAYRYIAPLHKACLGRGLPSSGGELNPNLLARPLPESVAGLLSARIPLVQGRLSISQYSIYDDSFIIWRFRPFHGLETLRDHQQILALEVRITRTIRAPFVRLRALNLSNGNLDRQFDLYPDRGSIQLVIKNEEGSEFMPGERARAPLGVRTARRRHRIFEYFYDLAVTPPRGEMPMPIVNHLVASGNDGGASSSPPCSPGSFKPIAYFADSLETRISAPTSEPRDQSPELQSATSSLESFSLEPRLTLGENIKAREIVQRVARILGLYGYLVGERVAETDEEIREVIGKFQRFYGLIDQDGELSPETLAALALPRCGLQDGPVAVLYNGRIRRLRPCPWRRALPFAVTYQFTHGTDVELAKAVTLAMDQWSKFGVATFQLAQREKKPDLMIAWRDEQSDPELRGNNIARAVLPCQEESKVVHFDSGEGWSPGKEIDRFNAESVALHELGHILGLTHSDDPDCIMYPVFRRYTRVRPVDEGDKARLRELYQVSDTRRDRKRLGRK